VFLEQKILIMNLYPTVVESVIVLRSKAKQTKKLLYLIGFEDEFILDILQDNEGASYEIVQKHQLKEVSIQSLIESNLSNSPEFALICDLNVLRKNNFQFLENVRKEKILQSVPFIVINRTTEPIDLKIAIQKGIDDCYPLPLKWENILTRIEFLIQHKKAVQKIGKVKSSKYSIAAGKRTFDIWLQLRYCF
jgi:CheY-like chemotaxis protein